MSPWSSTPQLVYHQQSLTSCELQIRLLQQSPRVHLPDITTSKNTVVQDLRGRQGLPLYRKSEVIPTCRAFPSLGAPPCQHDRKRELPSKSGGQTTSDPHLSSFPLTSPRLSARVHSPIVVVVHHPGIQNRFFKVNHCRKIDHLARVSTGLINLVTWEKAPRFDLVRGDAVGAVGGGQ